jgi:hypothetical protein
MQEKSFLSKFKSVINIICVLSATAMTYMLSINASSTNQLLGTALSFVLYCLIVFKLDFVYKTFSKLNKGFSISSFILASLTVARFFLGSYARHGIMNSAVWALSLPAIFILYAWLISNFYPVIIGFFKSLDQTDKVYLLVKMVLLTILIVIVFNLTSVFYSPKVDGTVVDYDVVYTTDSGNILYTDAYFKIDAPQNDLRQPLFGVFAAPFAMIAKIGSYALFFVDNAYPILINIIQVFLLEIALILLALMLKLKGKLKIAFYLFIGSTFPYLLFALNMEQYIFTVFWLVLFIYAAIEKKAYQPYLYIGAAGSMLTSGIVFPLLFEKGKFKQGIILFAKCLAGLLGLTIIFGQINVIITSIGYFGSLMKFTGAGQVLFVSRLAQYHNFLACVVLPNKADTFATPQTGIMIYHAVKSSVFSYISLSVFLLTALGFFTNLKNKLAKVCASWVAFSFVVLCLIGWGSLEYGYMLYALYFSWAFLVLIFMGMQKIIKNETILFTILIAVSLVLLRFNLSELYKIITFGMLHYPA